MATKIPKCARVRECVEKRAREELASKENPAENGERNSWKSCGTTAKQCNSSWCGLENTRKCTGSVVARVFTSYLLPLSLPPLSPQILILFSTLLDLVCRTWRLWNASAPNFWRTSRECTRCSWWRVAASGREGVLCWQSVSLVWQTKARHKLQQATGQQVNNRRQATKDKRQTPVYKRQTTDAFIQRLMRL